MSHRNPPKVTLVMRSFLDYRIPVFKELSRLLQGQLWIMYSQESTPERVQSKLKEVLGDRAIGFKGESALGHKGNITSEMANSGWRIPYQPGLVKKLKELNPDVVVGDGFFQWTWQAMVYHLFARKPLVLCYERTAYTERYAQWYRKIFRKLVLTQVSAMAVNGKLTREYVESMGLPSELITEGQMAADTTLLADRVRDVLSTDIQSLKRQFVSSPDAQIYLTIGQLISRKGIDHLLRGWKRHKEQRVNSDVLLIIGEGAEKSNLQRFCEEMDVEGVKFLGAVDYDNIHRYYAAADWFIIPTLEDNWSLVVPEAMACGLPVLCSKYNGCWPELVHDDLNGWVFDPLDLTDIVRVLTLSSQSTQQEEMAEASRKIVADHTPDHAAKAIFNACEIAFRR